jgi:formylmethanofuran dehydrogenase subunit E-like metal-binding protein
MMQLRHMQIGSIAWQLFHGNPLAAPRPSAIVVSKPERPLARSVYFFLIYAPTWSQDQSLLKLMDQTALVRGI